MNLFKYNKPFRILLISSALNSLGASLFNIVFLVYASTYENSKFYISLAALITVIPVLLASFIGYLADRVKNKSRGMILTSFLQAALFLALAFFITRKSPLIFLSLCIINLAGDFLAYFKGSLRGPIMQKNVEAGAREEAFGALQGVSSICDIVGQPAGVLLLSLFNQSYSILGFINAGAYLISGLVLAGGAKHLSFDATKPERGFKARETLSQIQVVFSSGKGGNFLILISSIIAINFVFAGIGPLIDLSMNEGNRFGLSFGYAVAILSGSYGLGMIIGSFTMGDMARKLSLTRLLMLITVLAFALSLSIIELFPLAAAILFALSYFIAKISPRLNALLLDSIPPESLGRVGGGLQTIFGIGIPFGGVFFIFMANATSVAFSLFLISCISCVLFIFLCVSCFSGKRKND